MVGDERYWPATVEPRPSPPGDGLDLLHDSVRQGATIVAVGPFTNLALLEAAGPGSLSQVPIVAVGGWFESPAWGQAEATRRAGLSLGEEARNLDIIGWAHEMRAWYSLTQGDYAGAIVRSLAAEAIAGNRGVSVQLTAQRARAWARIGDRREVELALEHGRALLENLPYPEDLDNHFVVDPAKFDFYAMDGYRSVGEDRRAQIYAEEVHAVLGRPARVERKPMRVAEARLTLGVLAGTAGVRG
jgi:hypothetical protein